MIGHDAPEYPIGGTGSDGLQFRCLIRPNFIDFPFSEEHVEPGALFGFKKYLACNPEIQVDSAKGLVERNLKLWATP